MKYKAIIFDIGGVVTQTDFIKLYANFARRIGIAPEFVIDYHKKNKSDLFLGKITFDMFCRDANVLAKKPPGTDFRAMWLEENFKVRTVDADIIAMINRLRENYKVGTLTNLTESRLIMDEDIGLYSHFDFAVLSCKVRMMKPDPRIYKLALSQAGIIASEAVFIDDNVEHISAGESLGIKGIIFVDKARLVKDLHNLEISV